MDDFSIKYWDKLDTNHLYNAVGANFRYTIDKEGSNYCSLTLRWNYKLGYVDTSMPWYIPKALKRLNHQPVKKLQYSPYKHQLIVYRKTGVQQIVNISQYKKLPQKDITYAQSVIGTFLYYEWALDFTMLPALNDIGLTQASLTEKTK